MPKYCRCCWSTDHTLSSDAVVQYPFISFCSTNYSASFIFTLSLLTFQHMKCLNFSDLKSTFPKSFLLKASLYLIPNILYVICCHITNYPKAQQLKITISGGSKTQAWCSLVLWLQSRYYLGLQSPQILSRVGSISKLIYLLMVGLVPCALLNLSSLLATDWKPPSVLCHVGFSIESLTTWQLASIRVRRESKKGRARQNPVFL